MDKQDFHHFSVVSCCTLLPEQHGVRCSGGTIDCDAEVIEAVRLLEPTRTLDDPGGLQQSDRTASESE